MSKRATNALPPTSSAHHACLTPSGRIINPFDFAQPLRLRHLALLKLLGLVDAKRTHSFVGLPLN